MLELFPEGFEEVDRPEGVELAAYTDAQGEEKMWHFFGGANADDVPLGWEDRWRDFHKPVQVGALWIGRIGSERWVGALLNRGHRFADRVSPRA